jgi:hypothetical protein
MNFPPYFLYLKNPAITWFNPCWGYYGFWKRLEEFQKEQGIDFQKAWVHRNMKRNKEIYASALAALSMQQDQPSERGWWLTKAPQDPPDGLIGTPILDKEQNANFMHTREVEIVEHFSGSIVETITRKLSRKAYEPHTILLCLLSPTIKDISVHNFEDIAKQIQQIKLPLAHIFLVGHGYRITSALKELSKEQLLVEMKKIMFVQLSPKYGFVNISPNQCCADFLQGKTSAWLKFTKIGRGTVFQQVSGSPPKLFD